MIEAKVDRGQVPVATVLIERGTLKVGAAVVAGEAYGKVKAMLDDKGERDHESRAVHSGGSGWSFFSSAGRAPTSSNR